MAVEKDEQWNVDASVKSLGENRIGGYLAAFSSPNDTDLEGQYFTKDTNFELDWYSVRPVLYSHGVDSSHKTTAIGTIEKLEIKDEGLWAEAKLRSHYLYKNAIERMIEEGVLAWSSGSSPYYAEVDRNGFIRTWPIHEGSLTERPAQPNKTVVKAIKHEIDIKALKNAVDDLGLKDYNLDELMLQYENNNLVKVKEGKVEIGRPLEIVNKVYIVSETKENNEGITMNEETKKDREVKGTVESFANPAEETTELKTSAIEEFSISEEIPLTEVNESAEVSDSYLSNRVADAMRMKEIPIDEENTNDAILKIKQWIKNRTFASVVSEEMAANAWSSDDFHKFYKELIEGYRPKEVKETQVEDPRYTELAAKFDALQQMIGMGGVSKSNMADVNENQDSAIHGFYYIPDAEEKAKYANHGFEDLAYYAYLRSQASRKSYLDRTWNLDEQDHLYEALYQTGKDIVPEIEKYIPNWHWQDQDILNEPIHAVKAFRAMHSNRGKAIKAADVVKAIKANEVFASPHSGRGSDWIFTLPDGTLWNTLLENHLLFNAMPKFNMMASSVEQYIDDEMGIASIVPEIVNAGVSATAANDAANSLGNYPITPPGSQKLTFNARHIGQQAVISKIEIEDARIDSVRSARLQLQNGLQRALVWSVLNAHNATTANQNYGWYGQAAGGTSAGKRGLAGIGFDGLIARALADSKETAGFQAGSDQCVDFLTATRRLMNQRYYSNHSQIRMVMQPSRCDLLWDLEEFKRAAQYNGKWDGGTQSFTSFQGTPIIKSEQVEDRNAAGQHHMTDSNNTRGVIVFFRPDRMKVGIRRRNTRTMTEYGAYQEHLRIGESIRFDFQIIPHAKEAGEDGAIGGSGLIRKPVSVLYDLN